MTFEKRRDLKLLVDTWVRGLFGKNVMDNMVQAACLDQT